MTLITAVLGGLLMGYLAGFHQRGLVIFAAIWSLVLIFQTFVLLDSKDVPPEAWEYVPVQVVIFAIGMLMLWLGARLRTKLGKSSPTT